jgi:hypothetical protein
MGEEAEAGRAPVVASEAEPMDSLSAAEIEALAYDYRHNQLLPDPNGDSLASLRRLSPEDLRRFRVALADSSSVDGLLRDMYDAYTDVCYEHRVFMLDAGPELEEQALRRALAKHSHEWPPELVEQAVQHLRRESMPPALRRF